MKSLTPKALYSQNLAVDSRMTKNNWGKSNSLLKILYCTVQSYEASFASDLITSIILLLEFVSIERFHKSKYCFSNAKRWAASCAAVGAIKK